jgi:hypothetical protein
MFEILLSPKWAITVPEGGIDRLVPKAACFP